MHKDEEPDFELVDCFQEPYFQVLNFLESRAKLGPEGKGLLHALFGWRPLA